MILFLTNADSELIALRSVAEAMPEGFPPLWGGNPLRAEKNASWLHEGVQLVLVRLLGGRRAWEEGLDDLVAQCSDRGVPLVALGGEAIFDAELAGASTVSPSEVGAAFGYLSQGGPANLEHCLRRLSDKVLGSNFGYEAPVAIPPVGLLDLESKGHPIVGEGGPRPRIVVVFYRAHLLAGNLSFVTQLCDQIAEAGGDALAMWCYSLRGDSEDPHGGPIGTLRSLGADVIITTVWASGKAGAEGEGWDASELASLGVPVLQATAATTSSQQWAESPAGLAPMDVAMSVAIPEFDGRIIGPAFAFKEIVDDGGEIGADLRAYRALPERTRRVARLAVGLGRLRYIEPSEARVAIVLSAYPTKRSRLGNAVGLDTPASVIALLESLAAAGYSIDRIPPSPDALMAELAAGLTYDSERPSPQEAAGGLARIPKEDYEDWFEAIDPHARQRMVAQWGEPPGVAGSTDNQELVMAGISLGNVVIAIQPPRGHGDDPIATYHSPDLPPTHHYLAFYRWLEWGFGAHAVVHVGKHGTLEWLPGKGVGLSGECFPDAVLGDLPFVYPFVVNDPGEGTQAKRRTHAVVVDHLMPPLTRADSYGGISEIESLLDTHAQVAALDPSKLPAIRQRLWEALRKESMDADLGLDPQSLPIREALAGRFEHDGFDDVVPTLDGYLCELKDAQIRGGLHILGRPPEGEELLDTIVVITRVAQGSIPSLRATVAARLGFDAAKLSRSQLDMVDAACRAEVGFLAEAGWRYEGDDPTKAWICQRLVPALVATKGELSAVTAALEGRHVPSGPSGAPSRGGAHVLPTGRNFYSLDPKAVPTSLSWDVGRRLAEETCALYRSKEGRFPISVAIVVWGTAAMRTGGDDIAQALALMGVRPRWSEQNGRVTGFEVMSLEELGRPRVDVTLRISGFFRDAFPNVLDLVDQAASAVAALEEPVELNPLVAVGSTARVFGPKPGSYGSGVLELIESGKWGSSEDLGALWLARSSWSYRSGAPGVEAAEQLRHRMTSTDVAVKNQDNREHDIFDSDDYLQDHGGMVAAIASLSGRAPLAAFGDSSDPSRPRARELSEEAARVLRSRVLNPKWIGAMRRHGYKGAFEMAATVDYLFGYDATAGIGRDWMYERVTSAYVGDPENREFFRSSNPWALRAIAERLLEAHQRGMWDASPQALETLRNAALEGEGWEEST